ncbi:hypothetical protein LTR85_005895 [Meristemomyces frigidus]|nr:hypothetical protein LTR85_005895 [Meristemomyces frigidus]
MAGLEGIPSYDGFEAVESKHTKRRRAWLSKQPAPPAGDPIDRPTTRQTRHEFSQPLTFARTPNKDDLVTTAREQLRVHNLSSIATLNSPLDISALADHIHPLPARYPNIRLCAIGCLGRFDRPGFMAKVPLMLEDSEHGPSRLMVLNGDESMPFPQWLSQLAQAPDPDLTGRKGYEVQYRWHAERGGGFNFLGLPEDLQKTVLLHMVGEVRHLDYHTSTHTHSLHAAHTHYKLSKYDLPEDPTMPPEINNITAGLLSLNKSINTKLMPIIEYWTIKHIDQTDTLSILVNDDAATVLRCLNRVQLSFTDAEYFDFFYVSLPGYPPEEERGWGVDTTAWDRDGEAPAMAISRLPNLRYLELWFDATLHCVGSNPWAGRKSGTHLAQLGIDARRFPCRKGMIDWIMCFAYRYIKDVPRVNMASYVKTVTRNKWLDVLRDKGHMVEHQEFFDEKVHGIEDMPMSDFPPICECDHPCCYPDLRSAMNYDDTHYGPWVARRRKCYIKEALHDYRFDFDDSFERCWEKGSRGDNASRRV